MKNDDSETDDRGCGGFDARAHGERRRPGRRQWPRTPRRRAGLSRAGVSTPNCGFVKVQGDGGSGRSPTCACWSIRRHDGFRVHQQRGAPYLIQETVGGTAGDDLISGATFTSQAYEDHCRKRCGRPGCKLRESGGHAWSARKSIMGMPITVAISDREQLVTAANSGARGSPRWAPPPTRCLPPSRRWTIGSAVEESSETQRIDRATSRRRMPASR